jgi:hypothetical protein
MAVHLVDFRILPVQYVGAIGRLIILQFLDAPKDVSEGVHRTKNHRTNNILNGTLGSFWLSIPEFSFSGARTNKIHLDGAVGSLDVYLRQRAKLVWSHILSECFEGSLGALTLDNGIASLFHSNILGHSGCGSSLFEERLPECFCVVLDCAERGLGGFQRVQGIWEGSDDWGSEIVFFCRIGVFVECPYLTILR